MKWFLVVLASLFLWGCYSDDETVLYTVGFQGEYGSLVDSRDGETYKTVVIGDQEWMAENLRYNVPEDSQFYSWTKAIVACPDGWHLPTTEEWNELVEFASRDGVAFFALAEEDGFEGYVGSNSTGFSAKAVPFVQNYGTVGFFPDRIRYWSFEEGEWLGYHWSGTYVRFGNKKVETDQISYYDAYKYPVRCIKGKVPERSDVYYSLLRSSSSFRSSSSSSVKGLSSSSSYEEYSCSSSEASSSSVVEESSSSLSPASSSTLVFVDPSEVVRDSFVDARDGQVYKSVKIGDQIWMAENLNFAVDSSFCYNDEPDNCEKYGRLYQWSAAMDSVGTFSETAKGCGYNVLCDSLGTARGVCPEGWHIPTEDEAAILLGSVDKTVSEGAEVEYAKGNELKSALDWDGEMDAYGFGALPSGIRAQNGNYSYLGSTGNLWLASPAVNNHVKENALIFAIGDYYGSLRYSSNKSHGIAVRCLKD